MKKSDDVQATLPAPIRVGAEFDQLFPGASARATEAVLNILRTATLVVARVAPISREFGLSVHAFSVLDALANSNGPMSPRTISRRLLVPAQTLTSVLDGLEQAGFVKRTPHPQDRRSVLVALTPEGQRVLHDTCGPVALAEHAWLSCLNPEEQERLILLLGRVQASLEADGAET